MISFKIIFKFQKSLPKPDMFVKQICINYGFSEKNCKEKYDYSINNRNIVQK